MHLCMVDLEPETAAVLPNFFNATIPSTQFFINMLGRNTINFLSSVTVAFSCMISLWRWPVTFFRTTDESVVLHMMVQSVALQNCNCLMSNSNFYIQFNDQYVNSVTDMNYYRCSNNILIIEINSVVLQPWVGFWFLGFPKVLRGHSFETTIWGHNIFALQKFFFIRYQNSIQFLSESPQNVVADWQMCIKGTSYVFSHFEKKESNKEKKLKLLMEVKNPVSHRFI